MRAAEKLVLLALADRADENHCCYPSIARLVADTCLDRKAIFSAVASLESRGLISVSREFGASNKYRLIGVPDRHKSSTENGTGGRRSTGTKSGTGSITKTPGTSTENDTAFEDDGSAESGTGLDETSTESGTRPENGTSTENGTRPVPKAVLEPVPKTGHEPTTEPTKNLKPCGGGELVVLPVRQSEQPPSPPQPRSIADWYPTPETIEALTSPIFGLIPKLFVEQQVIEFRQFWRDRRGTADSWDAKFIQRVPGEWRHKRATWGTEPPPAEQTADERRAERRAELSAAARAALEECSR